jgi:uncharacterized protein (DUF1697 family)
MTDACANTDRYIALLRGINVGGNNKIAMSELKLGFESCGFGNVVTYINSGNVLFDNTAAGAQNADADAPVVIAELKSICETMILQRFELSIAVNIISAASLLAAVEHAPSWWSNDKDSTHNAIFVIPPLTAEEANAALGSSNGSPDGSPDGSPKSEYEKIFCHSQVIFWTAPRKTFSRSRWAKVVSNKPIYNAITIRNANTTKKLAELARLA